MERNKKNENKRKKKQQIEKKTKILNVSSLTSSIVIHIAIFCKHKKVHSKYQTKILILNNYSQKKTQKKKLFHDVKYYLFQNIILVG